MAKISAAAAEATATEAPISMMMVRMTTTSPAGRDQAIFLGPWQSVKGLGGIDKGTARVFICVVIAALMLTCWSTLLLPVEPPGRRRRAGSRCVGAVESCQCHSCHPPRGLLRPVAPPFGYGGPHDDRAMNMQYPTSRPRKLLFITCFKCSRVGVFYLLGNTELTIVECDMVIFEADRGQDLGVIQHARVTQDEARTLLAASCLLENTGRKRIAKSMIINTKHPQELAYS